MILDKTIPSRHRPSKSHPTRMWQVGDLILDTFEVEQVFSSGGMAYVYRVYHRDWDLDLAVKTPRSEFLNVEGMVANFVREAETWVNLGLYPNIVSCYFIRVLDGIPRIFMEYVDNGSLLDSINQNWLYQGKPIQVLSRILDIAIQIAWGLQYAHQKGLVHQDVKPANILLTHDGIAKVTDFGMAQAKAIISPSEENLGEIIPSQDDHSILVNVSGMTPSYCSPEQAAGHPLSRRTDIWSWAVSLLEAFVGSKTWDYGPYALNGLEEYLKFGPQKPSIPRMPSSFADLLMKCFSFDPDDRPHSMIELVDSLKEIYLQEIGEPYPRYQPKMKTVLADTLNNRAISMVDLSKENEALELFDQAIAAQSTHPAALYNCNLFLWRSARLTDLDVLKVLTNNLKELPESWQTYYYLAHIHIERGDLLSAVKVIRSASERFGSLPSLRHAYQKAYQVRSLAAHNLKTLKDHTGVVNSVAISKQGEFALSAGNDHAVYLWDLNSGKCLRSMLGHDHIIRSVAISPGGELGLSGSWDKTLRLWNLRSGKCLQVLNGHTDVIQQVVFTPDGTCALSASSDHTLRLWDIHSGQCLRIFSGHIDTIRSVAVSGNGTFMVSASFDNTIRIWDLHTGQCLKTIEWIYGITSNICLTTDGKSVLLADANNRICLVYLETGELVKTYSGHTGTVRALEIAPNGVWILSGGIDGTVRIWDLYSSRCLRTFTGHSASVNALSISPEKMIAVSGSSDQTIKLWLLNIGPPASYDPVLPRSSEEVAKLSNQIDQQLEEAENLYSLGDFAGAIKAVAQARATPGYFQNTQLVNYWNIIGQKGVRTSLNSSWLARTLLTHNPGVNSITVSNDSRFALSGNDDTTLSLWNIESGECIHQYLGHNDKVRSVCLDGNGNLALSGSSDGTLILWDLKAVTSLQTLSGHTSEVNSVVMTSDGRLALSGSNDNSLRLWDLSEYKCIRVLKGHSHYVRHVAITPDGRFAVSAGWDKTLRYWDLASAECLTVFEGHEEVIHALALSSDGTQALTAGLDHSIRLWNLKSGETLAVMETESAHVSALCFSFEGRFAFSADQDGKVTVWDLTTGVPSDTPLNHASPVSSVAVSPAGDFLISAGTGRTIKIWQLDWEYQFPAKVPLDERFTNILSNFIHLHTPHAADGMSRLSRPSWSDTDIESLLRLLSYAGYGSISRSQIITTLKQLSKHLPK